jgi:protein involved in polysaccharide export with SLBB domain
LAGICLTGCQTENPEQFAEVPGAEPPPSAMPDVPEPSNTATNASTATKPPTRTASDPTYGFGTDKGDSRERIHVGDSLVVVFSDTPQPIAPFEERVNDEGNITLMYNRTFHAEGKTRGVVEREIRAEYVPKYFRNLTVTIRPQDRFFFVDGEVKLPARQQYVGRMTVLKAIASCGDFTDFAKRSAVRVTRANGRTFTVNCKRALVNPELDVEIFPGDKVHVPRSLL